MKKILIVTDGKPGHENQSKALCEALGAGYYLMLVSYGSKLMKALSYAADRLGVLSSALYSAEPVKGVYDGVVCTGSTAFYPGKVIASQLKIPVCAIMLPRGYRLNYDCILPPSFDNPPERSNIIPLPINFTAVNEDFYKAGTEEFLKRHKPERAAVAVIIGGPNAFADMDAAVMKQRFNEIFATTEGCERWVTTSRRTPPEIERLIDEYDFDYKLIFSREKFNPIPAFVSICERVFVTADSTGMISEAVTHGDAKVEILMNLSAEKSKFARFVDGLVKEGHAHIFEGEPGDAGRKVNIQGVVEQVREMLFSAANNGRPQ